MPVAGILIYHFVQMDFSDTTLPIVQNFAKIISQKQTWMNFDQKCF